MTFTPTVDYLGYYVDWDGINPPDWEYHWPVGMVKMDTSNFR